MQEQRESHIEQADIENEYRRIRKNLSYKYPFEASCSTCKAHRDRFRALASGEEISVYEKGAPCRLRFRNSWLLKEPDADGKGDGGSPGNAAPAFCATKTRARCRAGFTSLRTGDFERGAGKGGGSGHNTRIL